MSELDNLQHADGEINTETENTSVKTSEQHTTQAHLEAIEASNAEDAEDTSNAERHNIEEKDYSALSMDALVVELDALLTKHKVQTISKQVNAIKNEFNDKFNVLLEDKKEEFLAEGGNIIDFYFTTNTKKQFNTLYKSYRKNINDYYQNREAQLKQNLNTRLTIIEDIKSLLNSTDNMGATYKTFRELQEQWRNAGPIPRDKYNTAWNSYHHNVDRFYDFLHLSNEFRDLDFKHNYEEKLKIIDRAEQLANDDNIERAFRELQVLHKMWKEDLGPVPKEHRDTIWERFSNATKTIHEKRQAYFANIDEIYEKNLVKKEAIINDIKAIAETQITNHGTWQKKIRDIEALREAFFNAGKVPLKDNEPTWAKFKDAVRTFNRNKNAFYKVLKKEQTANLAKKQELVQIAEDNKNSDDFETVTPLMKNIQNQWKTIGHVPRRDSDKIWKQFKNACNHYFNRMHAERKAENSELFEAFEKKSKLLNDLKNFTPTKNTEADITAIKQHIATFKTIGHVPQNKRFIDGKFYKAIDAAFDTLNMDKADAEMIKFETKLESFANTDDTRLLDNELNFIRKKIDEVKAEINQLENNLQFFTNVKDDNPLVKAVHTNIAEHKTALNTWKQKLSRIRELY